MRLVLDSSVVIAAVRPAEPDHEDARAFDVAQEFVAQADALAGPLDQSRQIGQHEDTLAADVDDAEVGMLRREWIIRDLRRCLR